MIPRHFWISFSVVTFLVLVYQMFPNTSQKQDMPPALTLLELGYIPPQEKKNLNDFIFHIYTRDGENEFKKEEKKISDYAGKAVILHFWATWCGPCVQELPGYDDFAKENPHAVHLAVVSDKTSPEAIQTFFKNKGIHTLQIVKDASGASAKLGVFGIPTTVFIDKKGYLNGHITGPIEWKNSSVFNLILTLLH